MNATGEPWFVARERCRAKGMHLAYLPNLETDLQNVNLDHRTLYWIGLYNHRWTWVTGEFNPWL